MKISPMEIQRQTFATTWRGFDRDEVRTYLAYVAEEVATLQRERDSFGQEVQSLKSIVEDYRHREMILKNTLLTAQRVSDEIRENARRHADGIVKEAEIQADRLIELAQNRARSVERDLVDLRVQRQTCAWRCGPSSSAWRSCSRSRRKRRSTTTCTSSSGGRKRSLR